MAIANSTAIEAPEHELVITRIFDAPRSIVFKAWTDPAQLARWGGPKGMTFTIVKMDPRPGGAYTFRMSGSAGDHRSQGVYRELVAPERIVFTTQWADADGNPVSPATILTLTFEDHAGKTKLTLHQGGFDSAIERDNHGEGYRSTLERLAEYLEKA